MTLEPFQYLGLLGRTPLRHVVLQKFDQFPFKGFVTVKIFDDSGQSLELLLQFDPDVVSNKGYIARQSLIDTLLNANAGHDSVKVALTLSDIDETDDDPT
jgi:hypothetical protein